MSRIYSSVQEAYEEIEREIVEMGLDYQSATYQDKDVGDDDGFSTKELRGYHLIIQSPDVDEAAVTVDQVKGSQGLKWLFAEHQDRTTTNQNPGEAWKIRREVWEEFLEDNGQFSYSYPERMAWQIPCIIKELRQRPNSRQAMIEMHQNHLDLENMGGTRRIPCSLSYSFMVRRGAMDGFYLMRSSDYYTHFLYDMVLAIKLVDFIRYRVDSNLKMGQFHMFIQSLHAFKKDYGPRGIF